MCGCLHVRLATCVVGYMCCPLHVWSATCVVLYMSGWLYMCGRLREVPIIQNQMFNGHTRSVPINWEGLFSG